MYKHEHEGAKRSFSALVYAIVMSLTFTCGCTLVCFSGSILLSQKRLNTSNRVDILEIEVNGVNDSVFMGMVGYVLIACLFRTSSLHAACYVTERVLLFFAVPPGYVYETRSITRASPHQSIHSVPKPQGVSSRRTVVQIGKYAHQIVSSMKWNIRSIRSRNLSFISDHAFSVISRACMAGINVAASLAPFLIPVCLALAPRVLADAVTGEKNRHERYIYLVVIKRVFDVIALTAAVVRVCYIMLKYFFRQAQLSERHYVYVRRVGVSLLFALCMAVLYCAQPIVYRIVTTDAATELQKGILTSSVNPCAAEQMRMKTSLTLSWMLPTVLPRRIFTFYSGSESCHDNKWRSIGFIDANTSTLVVSAICADKTAPRVFLHRLDRSIFSGRVNSDIFTEAKGSGKVYYDWVETKYGTEDRIREERVIVRRNSDGLIASVEIDPATLTPRRREPSSNDEATARKRWPQHGVTENVFEVALGRSASYYLSCGELQRPSHEELFLFPLDPKEDITAEMHHIPPAPSSTLESADEPASNILILFLDAVSRQDIVRSLPKLVSWIDRFAEEQGKKREDEGYIVVELQAHTTDGHSTAGNLVPMLTGAMISDIPHEEKEFERGAAKSASNRSIFNVAKAQHGGKISTAVTINYCHDLYTTMFENINASGGYGGRYEGVDYYLFQPFCALGYGKVSTLLTGPYSMFKRCIINNHVHEYILNYSVHLLRRQLEQRNLSLASMSGKAGSQTKKNRFFVNMMSFIEGHEPSQSVLAQLDDALTEFMITLKDELHFFDDPLNSFLIMNDHGNHMSPSYRWTEAGQYERTTPAHLYILHPKMLARIDTNKNQEIGTSKNNLLKRAKRLSAPVDLYLTLGDMLNIELPLHEKYRNIPIQAKSFFESRDVQRSPKCNDFRIQNKLEPCVLDFCE